ncbi:glycosyltransferase family 59 protein, partial [Moniliophthora roreri]
MLIICGRSYSQSNKYQAGNFSVVEESEEPSNGEQTEHDCIWRGCEKVYRWSSSPVKAYEACEDDR